MRKIHQQTVNKRDKGPIASCWGGWCWVEEWNRCGHVRYHGGDDRHTKPSEKLRETAKILVVVFVCVWPSFHIEFLLRTKFNGTRHTSFSLLDFVTNQRTRNISYLIIAYYQSYTHPIVFCSLWESWKKKYFSLIFPHMNNHASTILCCATHNWRGWSNIY